MTMRIVFKCFPVGDEETQRAKSALEQVKTDVLVPRGAWMDGLTVVEGQEDFQGVQAKVVKIDGFVHLSK